MEVADIVSNDDRESHTLYSLLYGSLFGNSLVLCVLSYNLIGFLALEYNIWSITAILIHYGTLVVCSILVPNVIAIVADSLLDSVSVIRVYSLVSLLGMMILILTSTIPSLRPPTCEIGSISCEAPSKIQHGVMFLGLVLASSGSGGAYYAIVDMGVKQFEKPIEQAIFFEWLSKVAPLVDFISFTVINAIANNINWGFGFGFCAIVNALISFWFLCDKNFYLQTKLEGGLFTTIARIVVATIRRRSRMISPSLGDCTELQLNDPISSRNIDSESEMITSASQPKRWRSSTINEVEEIKKIMKIMSLMWCPDIFFITCLIMLYILTPLQALTLNQKKVICMLFFPSGSYPLFSMMVFVVSKRFQFVLLPKWKDHYIAKKLTLLRRIGISYVFHIIAMVSSSMIESRRLNVVRTHQLTNKLGPVVPMSNLWLIIPHAILGFGLVFHTPGSEISSLYLREFPVNTYPNYLGILLFFIGFHFSTITIWLLFLFTGWLPNNINSGRLDYVFSTLALLGIVSFVYFLFSAIRCKYQNIGTQCDEAN